MSSDSPLAQAAVLRSLQEQISALQASLSAVSRVDPPVSPGGGEVGVHGHSPTAPPGVPLAEPAVVQRPELCLATVHGGGDSELVSVVVGVIVGSVEGLVGVVTLVEASADGGRATVCFNNGALHAYPFTVVAQYSTARSEVYQGPVLPGPETRLDFASDVGQYRLFRAPGGFWRLCRVLWTDASSEQTFVWFPKCGKVKRTLSQDLVPLDGNVAQIDAKWAVPPPGTLHSGREVEVSGETIFVRGLSPYADRAGAQSSGRLTFPPTPAGVDSKHYEDTRQAAADLIRDNVIRARASGADDASYRGDLDTPEVIRLVHGALSTRNLHRQRESAGNTQALVEAVRTSNAARAAFARNALLRQSEVDVQHANAALLARTPSPGTRAATPRAIHHSERSMPRAQTRGAGAGTATQPPQPRHLHQTDVSDGTDDTDVLLRAELLRFGAGAAGTDDDDADTGLDLESDAAAPGDGGGDTEDAGRALARVPGRRGRRHEPELEYIDGPDGLRLPYGKGQLTASWRGQIPDQLRRMLATAKISAMLTKMLLARDQGAVSAKASSYKLSAGEQTLAQDNLAPLVRCARLEEVMRGQPGDNVSQMAQFLEAASCTLLWDGLTFVAVQREGRAFGALPLCHYLDNRSLGNSPGGHGAASIGAVVGDLLTSLALVPPRVVYDRAMDYTIFTDAFLSLRRPAFAALYVNLRAGAGMHDSLEYDDVLTVMQDFHQVLRLLFGTGGPVCRAATALENNLKVVCKHTHPDHVPLHQFLYCVQYHYGCLVIDIAASASPAGGPQWATTVAGCKAVADTCEAGREGFYGFHDQARRVFRAFAAQSLARAGSASITAAGGSSAPVVIPQAVPYTSPAAPAAVGSGSPPFGLVHERGARCYQLLVHIASSRALGGYENATGTLQDSLVSATSPSSVSSWAAITASGAVRKGAGKCCPFVGAGVGCPAGPTACYFEHAGIPLVYPPPVPSNTVGQALRAAEKRYRQQCKLKALVQDVTFWTAAGPP